jgi:hypothetical protein
MSCRSIADILRRMGITPPSESATIAIADEAPVPLATPWIDRTRIAAANARDVLGRSEDDRSRAERSAQASQTLAAMRAAHRVKFKPKAKSAPKPKVKRERTPELREYFRNYGRLWRARKKAEADAIGT